MANTNHSLTDRSDRFCVIGAGTSGLVVTKTFRQMGIPVDCLEREDDLAGNWNYGRPHSSVYRSVRLISSKQLTEYLDFPMPDDYPEYPNHEQALAYIRAYAEHFRLYESIEFDTSVCRVEPAGEYWNLELADGQRRLYRGVVIANGHNWDPKFPSFPGCFRGMTLHSSGYKTPAVIRNRRVLVVGAGNSGCDLAVEAAQHAAKTFHSVRRGYHYLPRFIRGKPIDQAHERLLRMRFPLGLRRIICGLAIGMTLRRPQITNCLRRTRLSIRNSLATSREEIFFRNPTWPSCVGTRFTLSMEVRNRLT